jgi:DeoR/GlpR family transcriptional regulator of sugar metabolism
MQKLISGLCSHCMSNRPENLSSRQILILDLLQASGSVSVDELCSKLQVSVATVRRDLQDLEKRAFLRRTHGGAVLIEPLFYEPFRHDPSFQDLVGSFPEEKRRIARAASELVENGNTVALSGGTTTTEVVRSLRQHTGITVITNTVNVAMELSTRKDIEVVVTGGSLRGSWFTLIGPLANAAAQVLFADIMFIGVNGIHPTHGLTCLHPQEAEFLKAMAQHCKKKVVVTDHSKIGVTANWLLCPASEIDMLITDTGASEKEIAPFQTMGIDVRRV